MNAPVRHDAAVPTAPRIAQGQPVKVAVVKVAGPEPVAFSRALRALYASVGAVRAASRASGSEFEIGSLRARFPEAQTGPLASWSFSLAVRIPSGTVSLPQFDSDHRVRIEVWVYDLLAEMVHEGPEATKPVSVVRLAEFLVSEGYRPSGAREEIYLGTGVSGGRTLLRYPVVPSRARRNVSRARQDEGARDSSLRTARARRSISSQ